MIIKPYIQSHLKDMNRLTVYRLVSAMKEISKAEVSRLTGISAPTVIKIMNFFIESGLVVDGGEGDSALGRKPHMLKFNPDAYYAVGVMLEGNFLRLGIVNLYGDIKSVNHLVLEDLNFNNITGIWLTACVKEFIDNSGIDKDKILGIGMGLPAILDNEKKLIKKAPFIGVYEPKDYREVFEKMEKELDLPVIIENDVNAAAIGEFVYRNMVAEDELIYISLGTGLGAGLILNGKLRRGKNNSAGELGYMVLDPDFRHPPGDAGWLENKINFKALTERFSLSIKDIEAAENNKESKFFKLRSQIIDYIAPKLALCIVNFPMQLDVDLIVLGGIITELLGQELIDRVNALISELSGINIDIRSCKCSEPGIVGSASMVIEQSMDLILAEKKTLRAK